MPEDIHPQAIDDDTRQAVAALVHRIRRRDGAATADEPVEDAELFALEFMVALRGQGWRPTPARPAVGWSPHIGPAPAPEVAERGAEIARQVLAGGEAP